MTKEEMIREGYGESYESLKNNINIDDGYVYVQVIARLKTDGTEYENFGFTIKDVDLDFSAPITEAHFKWRPKLLRGVENNNGWKKIESRADLPKSDGQYLFMIGTRQIEQWYQNDISIGSWTHWRKIEKIPNPIY